MKTNLFILVLISSCLTACLNGSGSSSKQAISNVTAIDGSYTRNGCHFNSPNYSINEINLVGGTIIQTIYDYNNSTCSGAPINITQYMTGTYQINTSNAPLYMVHFVWDDITSVHVDSVIEVQVNSTQFIFDPNGTPDIWVRQ